MIKYRKTITMSSNNDLPMLKTDLGQTWNTVVPRLGVDNIGDWWDHHRHDELGEWQKDALIRGLGNASDSKVELYLPYRKGHGYDQRPDIALARLVKLKTWILSTSEHTWLSVSSNAEVIFDIDEALGPITDPETRDIIYVAECKLRRIPYAERVKS